MVPFDQYAQHDETRMFEWIDGAMELVPSLSPAQEHMRARLLKLLGDYVEESSLGLVIPAPFAIRMPEEMRRGREPDLLFIPHEFVETVQENYVNSHGVSLVIEITDARNRQLDSQDKFHDYEMAGIWEYWIVDVDRRETLFFLLIRDRYERVDIAPNDTYHARSLRGFSFTPASLWQ
jgi:Uma2 family endonuclease